MRQIISEGLDTEINKRKDFENFHHNLSAFTKTILNSFYEFHKVNSEEERISVVSSRRVYNNIAKREINLPYIKLPSLVRD